MSGGREKGKILFIMCCQMLSYIPPISVQINITIPPTNSSWCAKNIPDHWNQPMWKTFRGSTYVLRIHKGKLLLPHMISLWTSCFPLLRHWLMTFSRVGPLRVWNTADRYLIVFEEHSLGWGWSECYNYEKIYLSFWRAWQSDWSLRLECFHQTIDGIALDCCDKVENLKKYIIYCKFHSNKSSMHCPHLGGSDLKWTSFAPPTPPHNHLFLLHRWPHFKKLQKTI